MILLLGGTTESRQLADFLKKNDYQFVLSTMSIYGKQLAEEVAENVQGEMLDEIGLERICIDQKISLIIDATHPFAVNISENAIRIAHKLKIPYLRFERDNLNFPEDNSLVYIVANSSEAAQLAGKLGNNILLTIGSRQLANFQDLIAKKQVFVRVLPDIGSIEKCLKVGLKPNQILAMQGTFSKHFNKALFQEKKIEVVITKNSGSIGGTDAKFAACLDLKIPIIIIERPQITYPKIAHNFSEIADFLQEERNELSNKSPRN